MNKFVKYALILFAIGAVANVAIRSRQEDRQTAAAAVTAKRDAAAAPVFAAMKTTVMGQMQRSLESGTGYEAAIAEGDKYVGVADSEFLTMLQRVKARLPLPAAPSGVVQHTFTVADSVTLFCTVTEKQDGVIKCDNSFSEQSISVTMNARDPQAMCDGMAQQTTATIRNSGKVPLTGWRLLLVSPFSNGTPVAACSF